MFQAWGGLYIKSDVRRLPCPHGARLIFNEVNYILLFGLTSRACARLARINPFLHNIFKVYSYDVRMKSIWLLLFLLVIALVLQNTCPYSFASRTAFIAPHTHDCPLQKSPHNPAKDRDSVDDNPGKLLYPSFVFSVPDAQAIIYRSQINSEYTALSSDSYKDPLKEPSIKPPVS